MGLTVIIGLVSVQLALNCQLELSLAILQLLSSYEDSLELSINSLVMEPLLESFLPYIMYSYCSIMTSL